MKTIRILQILSRQKKITIALLAIFLSLLTGFLDYTTGSEVSISIFYLVPVGLSTWFVGRRAGFITGLMCAMIWYVADALSSPSYSVPVIPYWNALVLMGFFAALVWILSALRLAINRENSLALRIQQGLLPKGLPKIITCDIDARWLPARTISGDSYDVILQGDSTLGISIGDVAGHGIPAALLMSHLQASSRALSTRVQSAKEMCTQLNNLLVENMAEEKFISFFYGMLDTNSGSLRFCNAGHPAPILLRRGKVAEHLVSGGLLLGVIRDFPYEENTIQLSRGDVIILYTDGLTEAQNSRGEQFGENRVIEACGKLDLPSAAAINQNILKSLGDFSNNVFIDDVTLMTIMIN